MYQCDVLELNLAYKPDKEGACKSMDNSLGQLWNDFKSFIYLLVNIYIEKDVAIEFSWFGKK